MESEKPVENKTTTEKKKPSPDPEDQISDEDRKIMEEVELLVERVQDKEAGIQKMALEDIAERLRTVIGTMTSVPKPLKYLRPHFEELKTYAETQSQDAPNTLFLYDILSFLATTIKNEERECLHFKMRGNRKDIATWGHEYIRQLSGEVGQEFQDRMEEKQDVDDLFSLVDEILPFFLSHNGEIDACDLLLEVESLEKLVPFCEERNYKRVCQYLMTTSMYAAEGEELPILRGAYDVFRKLGKDSDAARVALRMNDEELAVSLFHECSDRPQKRQIAYLFAKHGFHYVDCEGDEELEAIVSNCTASEDFLAVCKDLDILEPKALDDIYRYDLIEKKPSKADSSSMNIASSLVSAFVNAGCQKDKLILEDEKWIHKNRESGVICAVAAVGMLMMWDVDMGMNAMEKYSNGTNMEKAGALLGYGVLNSGIRHPHDIAFLMLMENLEGVSREERVAAIMAYVDCIVVTLVLHDKSLSMGLAHAGSKRTDILDSLIQIAANSDEDLEIVAFASLALATVFAGEPNESVVEVITNTLMERSEEDLKKPLAKLICLALGLLFLGRQEASEGIIEMTKVMNEAISRYCEITIMTCAYAGTGNVLKVQELLHLCSESPEENKDNSYQSIAVLGIALISTGEFIGSEMSQRTFGHLLHYGSVTIRRAVPLALALLYVSNPKISVVDILSKLSHDVDESVARSAILSLGFVGSGTNNARIAQLLRQLTSYYQKKVGYQFAIRLAQGILFMGKGTITLSPYHSDELLLSRPALAGLLIFFHSALDFNNFSRESHPYLIYHLVLAMKPRFVQTVDEEGNRVSIPVRVGQSVDTVSQAGKPRAITGFQTHDTPVLLQYGERAELATDEYISLAPVLDGIVVVKKNTELVE